MLFTIKIFITIIFISAYAWRVKKDVTRINQLLLATKLALEREQKLTALGINEIELEIKKLAELISKFKKIINSNITNFNTFFQ